MKFSSTHNSDYTTSITCQDSLWWGVSLIREKLSDVIFRSGHLKCFARRNTSFSTFSLTDFLMLSSTHFSLQVYFYTLQSPFHGSIILSFKWEKSSPFILKYPGEKSNFLTLENKFHFVVVDFSFASDPRI